MPPNYALEWVDFQNAFMGGNRIVCHGSALQIRKQTAEMQKQHVAAMPPPDDKIDRCDYEIPVETGPEKYILRARVHKPRSTLSVTLPIGVYFHSGGFIMGDLDTEASFCDDLAKEALCVIVQGSYRLAPEHAHPAAFDDARIIWRWARAHADLFGGDIHQVFSIGSAVGGTMALSLAADLANEAGRSLIRGCVALAPVTLHYGHLPNNHLSYKENADAWMVDQESMKVFLDAAEADGTSARQFPALTKSQSVPTYISICGADVLRDDGIIMAQVLTELGTPVKVKSYEGMPHFFWAFPIKQAEDFRRDVLDGIKFVLA